MDHYTHFISPFTPIPHSETKDMAAAVVGRRRTSEQQSARRLGEARRRPSQQATVPVGEASAPAAVHEQVGSEPVTPAAACGQEQFQRQCELAASASLAAAREQAMIWAASISSTRHLVHEQLANFSFSFCLFVSLFLFLHLCKEIIWWSFFPVNVMNILGRFYAPVASVWKSCQKPIKIFQSWSHLEKW